MKFCAPKEQETKPWGREGGCVWLCMAVCVCVCLYKFGEKTVKTLC